MKYHKQGTLIKQCYTAVSVGDYLHALTWSFIPSKVYENYSATQSTFSTYRWEIFWQWIINLVRPDYLFIHSDTTLNYQYNTKPLKDLLKGSVRRQCDTSCFVGKIREQSWWSLISWAGQQTTEMPKREKGRPVRLKWECLMEWIGALKVGAFHSVMCPSVQKRCSSLVCQHGSWWVPGTWSELLGMGGG